MKQRLSLALAICVLMLLAVPALAQAPQPFSADMSQTAANGNINMKGKVYFALPKFRMDMADTGQHQGGPFGGKMSMIVDGDAKKMYMLMTEAQMYMEVSTDANNPMAQRAPKWQDFKGDPCTFGNNRQDATCKKVGTETINGRTCDKWEVTEKSGRKETLWIDQKLHFPIKATDGQITTEFSNIKEGAQDASLFKVPAGYRPFDPSAMRPPRPH